MKKSVSRTLAMALAACMAAGTLAACGSSGSSAVASSAAESTADSTAASTESGGHIESPRPSDGRGGWPPDVPGRIPPGVVRVRCMAVPGSIAA